MLHRQRLVLVVTVLAVGALLAASAAAADGVDDDDDVPEIETFELTYEEDGTMVTDEEMILEEVDGDTDAIGVAALYDGEEVYNETYYAPEEDVEDLVLVEDGGFFGLGTGDVVEVYVTLEYHDGNYRVYRAVHEWGDEGTTTVEDLTVWDESLFDVTVEVENEDGDPIPGATAVLDGEIEPVDESGTAEYSDVGLGSYEIDVDAEEYEMEPREVDIAADEEITLTLEEPSEQPLTVDVVDENGTPIEGVVSVGDEIATGETIEFELEPGEHEIEVDAAGYESETASVQIADEPEAVTVALENDGDGTEDEESDGDDDTPSNGDGDDANGEDGEEAAAANGGDEGSSIPADLLGFAVVLVGAVVLLLFVVTRSGGDEPSDGTDLVRYD